MDQHFGPEDISDETLMAMVSDCERFLMANAEDIATAVAAYPKPDAEALATAGHDFWLTRYGHGAGYSDGDLQEALGKRLARAAGEFGNVDLYVGDDGMICC